MNTQQKISKAREIHEKKKQIDREYNIRCEEHQQLAKEFAKECGEEVEEIEDVFPVLKHAIQKNKQYYEKNRIEKREYRSKVKDVFEEIRDALERELHYKTIVISDMEDFPGKPSITIGKYGWGIRKNKQARRLKNMRDVQEILRRKDDCIETLKEKGFENEAKTIQELYDAIEPLVYHRPLGFSPRMTIPLKENIIGFRGTIDNPEPMEIDTIFVRGTEVEFADTSVGNWLSYARHNVKEFDSLVVEQLEQQEDHITKMVQKITRDYTLQELFDNTQQAVRRQKVMQGL